MPETLKRMYEPWFILLCQ